MTLSDTKSSNNYLKNIATFNSTDELVLSDGVLWDVRGRQVIHKFDKFNNYVSGVFHPSDLEIVINSEIVSYQPCLARSTRTKSYLMKNTERLITPRFIPYS